MPFYALVEALTGDLVDVVPELAGDLPAGVIAVELPMRDEDLRAWIRQRKRNRGGGAGDELLLERDDPGTGAPGGQRDQTSDAEHFFQRLDQELLRAEVAGRQFGVLLFELAPVDRDRPHEFVQESLRASGQDLLPCDLVARVRDHLAGVILPDVDTHALSIEPERGSVTPLTYAADRPGLLLLRRRQHPLLGSRRISA